MRAFRYFGEVWQDLVYAARQARRSPAFTVVAVLSLALGISANTTIFSAINAVLIRPLPYANSDRLFRIGGTYVKEPGEIGGVSRGDIVRWRKDNRVFDALGWISGPSVTVFVGHGVSERVGDQFASPGLLESLGVKPALGRFFTEEDVRSGGLMKVVLTYPYWKSRFGGDPGVLGRTYFLDNQDVIIVGVASPGFDFFGQGGVDMLAPLDSTSADAAQDSDRWLSGVARLAPGVSPEQAQAAMSVRARQLQQAEPEIYKDLGIGLKPLQESLFGPYRLLLYFLFGAVTFVLLIACANVASLLLSRASARRKEVGIRTTLGAGRARLVRQLLTESVFLAVLGGVLGILLTHWAVKLFVAISPDWFPQARMISIDWRVLAFTLGVSVLTGILFGLAPAFRASRVNLTETLKEGGQSSAAGFRHRTRSALVVVEVALALLLLVCAGLMTNTFLRILHTDPGFRQEQVAAAEIRFSGPKYFDTRDYPRLNLDTVMPPVGIACRRILERVKTVPGIEDAALIDWLPMLGRDTSGFRPFAIGGRPAAGTRPLFAIFNAVSPDYFRVMGVPLLKGRHLTEQDSENAPWVVLINEAMAARYWPHQDPVGQVIQIAYPGNEERPREVVGVVGNTRQYSARNPAMPEMYANYPQQGPHCTAGDTESRLHKSIVFRTRYESNGLNQAVLRAIREVDPESPVYGFRPIRQVVTGSMSIERFFMQVLGGFSALALLLAAIGIYGVISYSVIERSHEIGIRMALGARPREVVRMVLGEGMLLTLIGAAIGLGIAYLATPVLANLLYGVKSHDPLTLAAAVGFLCIVSLAAICLPAWRAAKSDPLVALRHE